MRKFILLFSAVFLISLTACYSDSSATQSAIVSTKSTVQKDDCNVSECNCEDQCGCSEKCPCKS